MPRTFHASIRCALVDPLNWNADHAIADFRERLASAVAKLESEDSSLAFSDINELGVDIVSPSLTAQGAEVEEPPELDLEAIIGLEFQSTSAEARDLAQQAADRLAACDPRDSLRCSVIIVAPIDNKSDGKSTSTDEVVRSLVVDSLHMQLRPNIANLDDEDAIREIQKVVLELMHEEPWDEGFYQTSRDRSISRLAEEGRAWRFRQVNWEEALDRIRYHNR